MGSFFEYSIVILSKRKLITGEGNYTVPDYKAKVKLNLEVDVYFCADDMDLAKDEINDIIKEDLYDLVNNYKFEVTSEENDILYLEKAKDHYYL